jgi:hypothetical protein
MTAEPRAKAQKASLEQQQHQLADRLATTRGLAGWQETGQSSQPDVLASATTAAVDWLVFDDPAPPAATVVPIRYFGGTSDWMFGDTGARSH